MASSRNPLRTEIPAQALANAVSANLLPHVCPQDHLLIGLSGGIDSVVLLHVLATRLSGLKLSALHVHHGLSPQADHWAQWCAEYARQLGINFHCEKVVVERGSPDGLEAAARRARYDAFDRQAGDWVLLAHHLDDQAETLLFNLLRGSGLAGAAAMRICRGRRLRPLLTVSRAQIERYARDCGLTWICDESNADTRFSRNYLRHRVMAPLAERFPAGAKNLAAACDRFAESLALLDALARLDAGGDDFPVSVESLQALDAPRARNVLRYLLSRHGVPIPGEARLREALRQLLTAAVDRHPSLSLGAHRLLRRRGWIYLEPLPGNRDNC